MPKFNKSVIYYENQVIVLMYHDMDPSRDLNSRYNMLPNQFSKQLDALHEYGFHVISMDCFLKFMEGDSHIPPNSILITFDDGYRSFYSNAYPELKKRGYPASNFIIAKRVDMNFERYMTWKQMREMMPYNIRFFSHTYNHHSRTNDGESKPLLTTPIFLEAENRMETEKEYQVRIKDDLLLAEKRILEQLGEQPKLLCFPFGAYNNTIINIGQQIGIKLFFTVRSGLVGSKEMLVKRVNAGDSRLSTEDFVHVLLSYRE